MMVECLVSLVLQSFFFLSELWLSIVPAMSQGALETGDATGIEKKKATDEIWYWIARLDHQRLWLQVTMDGDAKN